MPGWLRSCLWLVSLIVERKRLYPQPLALPLLAYIVLSGLSCAFSYEPYMSWPHMKLVCWTALIATLFAQNLERLSQVRTLILLLLLSATAVGGFTAWQYLRGMGLQIVSIRLGTPLYLAGLRPDDMLVAINDHSLHSQNDIVNAVAALPPSDSPCACGFFAALPCARKRPSPAPEIFSPGRKAHDDHRPARQGALPYRAAGTLGHYGKLAEVFAPIGCLAWALMLGTPARKRWRQLLFAVMFLAITAPCSPPKAALPSAACWSGA